PGRSICCTACCCWTCTQCRRACECRPERKRGQPPHSPISYRWTMRPRKVRSELQAQAPPVILMSAQRSTRPCRSRCLNCRGTKFAWNRCTLAPPLRRRQSIFRRSVQRFAAENAINARNLEHDPIPKERIMLQRQTLHIVCCV